MDNIEEFIDGMKTMPWGYQINISQNGYKISSLFGKSSSKISILDCIKKHIEIIHRRNKNGHYQNLVNELGMKGWTV